VAEQLIAAQRVAIAERLAVALPLLKGWDIRSHPESPLIWLPLPEPWRASQFSAALRQAGVLVRTADHFAVGRSPAPHAVRISVNAAKSCAEVASGMQKVLGVLHGAPTAQMDP
jgi:DNA-binding transcriptional MocR family regulator